MSTPSNLGTALITGASTGIGSVYAHRLAQRGYDLILVARNQKLLSTLANEITAKTGRQAETLAADLTVKADLKRVEERLRSDDNVTALVNNAGFGGVAKLIDSDVDEMDNMIQLNVTALTRLTSAALPGFLERSKGLIINISSSSLSAPNCLTASTAVPRLLWSVSRSPCITRSRTRASEYRQFSPEPRAPSSGIAPSFPSTIFPAEFVMTAEEMVDASLAGLDQGELITIPALANIGDWEKFEEARKALGPNLSRKHSAARYGVHASA